MLFKLFTRVQIFIFRLTRGKSMAFFRGMPILLLITVGRKSGKTHTIPVMYFRDGDSFVITASNGGRPRYPAWFHNLKNASQVEMEIPGKRLMATPSIATEQEHARLWQQLVAQAPFFEDYRKRAPRPIPMVLLRPQ
jgi:F420H(2)-dependent quinone reductase